MQPLQSHLGRQRQRQSAESLSALQKSQLESTAKGKESVSAAFRAKATVSASQLNRSSGTPLAPFSLLAGSTGKTAVCRKWDW